jgi:hypothetical protein
MAWECRWVEKGEIESNATVIWEKDAGEIEGKWRLLIYSRIHRDLSFSNCTNPL